jgi:CHASE2 domain-containing sensor protein
MAAPQTGILSGLIVIGIVIATRLTGSLQLLEWMALDTFLRLRPPEPLDERIVIVGINETDVQRIGVYPIPDQQLASLLKTLSAHRPAAIGLDVVRDLPVEPGHRELVVAFNEIKNLIGVEKIIPEFGSTIHAPPGLPTNRVGIVDQVLDDDGHFRRVLLGASSPEGEYKFSFTIRLAQAYLSTHHLSLENGILNPEAMRFGSTELTQFQPNYGGYIGADAGGNQMLLNFRSGQVPFRILSLQDIRTGNFDPSWIRDRIVLVGMTAISARDAFIADAVTGPGFLNSHWSYGVEIQAHAISQIISAVLDQRPLLKVWTEPWEYLWIIVWGVIGIVLGRAIESPGKHLSVVCLTVTGLMGVGYLLIIPSWWIPVVPSVLVLLLNGIVLHAFYLYDKNLKARIQERQSVVEQTFSVIHNKPLQTLAQILRNSRETAWSSEQLNVALQALNQELRDVYEAIRQETLAEESKLYLSGEQAFDLHIPLHEILYEVYSHTLRRNLACFQTLKIQITKFEPMDSRFLSVEQKRGLCRFLEEALYNVGKHAIGVTRLTVFCIQEQDHNLIRVVDDGVEYDLVPASNKLRKKDGWGTQQARNLARQLAGGRFQRLPNSPRGTICELRWNVRRPTCNFWKIWPL